MKRGTFASLGDGARQQGLTRAEGPTRPEQPFGILPPSRWNFCGSRRNSTISSSSCLASSIPATSSKVTRPVFSVSNLALDFPNPMALPPPDCIWRMKKIQTPINSSIGNQDIRIERSGLTDSRGSALIWVPDCEFEPGSDHPARRSGRFGRRSDAGNLVTWMVRLHLHPVLMNEYGRDVCGARVLHHWNRLNRAKAG